MLSSLFLAADLLAALTPADKVLLDDIERAAARYFWEAADPKTGLVKDRSKADGPDAREIASTAATGFGLTGLCIAHERKFLPREDTEARVLATLRYLWDGLLNEHGFFYHFVNMRTGERAWKCELSTIDTAILLCGVLTCGEYFRDAEIRALARDIYLRVDWQWMLVDDKLLAHGWKPETGFLKATWNEYCELMMLYLLAIGSPTHAIPAETWNSWKRPAFEYEGLRYVNPKAPLFVHQYSHAWFDFRDKRDAHLDYFENSVIATKAHRLFCINLRSRFPEFGETFWGITASDSAKGYRAWGGPPELGRLDGTLVPCAAAGSLPFLPRETLDTLHAMRKRFGDEVWKRYGFIDAFNPHTDWRNPDVIGIDVGISLLMAENLRSGLVWKTFMKNPDMQRAMRLAGFKKRGE
jgi:hypothetical protein